MAIFSHATVSLARFDDAVTVPELETDSSGTSSLRLLGSDDMLSRERIGTRTSHVWALLELHRTEEDAWAAYRPADGASPLFDGATERWSAVLQPFSHRGETNWSPDPLFAPGNRRSHEGPFVVITTAGFDPELDPDLTRTREFIRGTAAVRSSFAATPGLRCEHAFAFGVSGIDGFTLTMWDDDSALRPPVYETGEHRTRMEDYLRNGTADRSSFTRLRVLESSGAWNGGGLVDRSA